MKRTTFLALLGLGLFVGLYASAEYRIPGFALTENAQCVGGTLLKEHASVYDAPNTFNARGTAETECQSLLSGQNQCCSVAYQGIAPANASMGSTGALGTHSFTYKIYKNATVGSAPSSQENENQIVGATSYWAGLSGTQAQAPTASIVANPNSVTSGGSTLLTWSSANADRCTSSQFGTQDARSGSVTVTPSETTVYSITCSAASGSATAQVTVLVSGGTTNASTFQASCRAHPTSAAVGEDVLWSSTVSGPPGLYYYKWSGTDALSGTASQVFKQYVVDGFKTGQLTVTYKPQSTSQASSMFETPVAHAACTEVVNQNQWYSAGEIVPLAFEGTLSPIECAGLARDAGYTHWNRSVENRCPGVGFPCEHDPSRTFCAGVNNPGPLVAKPPTNQTSGNPLGGYPMRFDSGNVCDGSMCPAGQSATPTFNVQGASCTGGTEIGRESEMHDAVQIGMFPDGYFAQKCAGLGAVAGDCCQVSLIGSIDAHSSYPSNSYTEFRVVRGGTFSDTESYGMMGSKCNLQNSQTWQCSSVAGTVGVSCSAGGGETITVDCDNGVRVGAGGGGAECSDGIDNDGDGDIDVRDRGCTTGSGYNPNDPSEGSTGDGVPQCSDGKDNNGDGTADYPEDPGCASPNDNLELIDAPDLTLTVNPPLIKKDQACTVTLSARSVSSCTLSGPGVTRSFSALNGFLSLKEVITPTLSQTSTYTLSCTGLNGKKAAKSVDCKIAPTFEEI